MFTVSKKVRVLLILITLFVCSVLIRFPRFDGYLSWHHQWLTAHTLLTLNIWDDNGVSTHKFSPVYTFHSRQDKNIQSLTSGIVDAKGDYYYVSYPPFSFLFAYAVFSVVQAPMNVYSMYCLNLSIHFLTVILLYLVIHAILRTKPFSQYLDAGIIGAIFYLFLPLPLWCHGHIYFADTIIQPMWLAGILLAFKMIFADRANNPHYLMGIGAVIFLMIYTEWLGVFFAFIVACYALVRAFMDKRYWNLVATIVLVAVASLSLTLIQYSSIAGFEEFINASVNKYISRGGLLSQELYINYIRVYHTLRFFFLQNLPLLAILLFLTVANTLFRLQGQKSEGAFRYPGYLLFLGLPPLLHHVVFREFTYIHDFALLKTTTWLIILAAVLYQNFAQKLQATVMRSFQLTMSAVLVILICLCSYLYHEINGEVDSPVFRNITQKVLLTSSPDDVIYITGKRQYFEKVVLLDEQESSAVAPQIQLVLNRTIMAAPSYADVLEHMETYDHNQAVIYTINSVAHIVGIQRVTLASQARLHE